MTRFVLDCSVTMSWCFGDESSAYGDAVLVGLEMQTAVVPSHWPLEVGNVLAMCERKGRVTEARIVEFLGMLTSLPIIVDEHTAASAFGDVLALARSHRLTTYDAAYLELAKRTNCPLASLDAALNTAATALGIALWREQPSSSM